MVWNNSIGEADLDDDDGVLLRGDPLVTSYFVSLFTRRQVIADATQLPSVPNGWWADSIQEQPLGSRLWTLRNAKISQETLVLMELFSDEALAWWLTDGVAVAVTNAASRTGLTTVQLRTDATRPDGGRWQHVWEGQLDGL
jgi:phage gp46-like protein